MFSYGNTQNIQHHLFSREREIYPYGRVRPVSRPHEHFQRELYKCIVPNLTIQNVDKPLVFLRNFTPNGKLLLGISYDQSSLEVFQYNGVGMALGLLSNQNGEVITSADTSCTSLTIRQRIFDCLLKKLYSVRLVQYDASRRPAKIHREFSIFVRDGQFVLLATLRDIAAQEPHDFDRLIRYPDFWAETDRANYTFFLIQLKDGKIMDSIQYVDDSIKLTYNHNVSVWENNLAIFSNTRQCIDLYEFTSFGKLVLLRVVGVLDNDIYRQLHDSSASFISFNFPFSSLKQKILSYMYKKIINTETSQRRREELQRFYESFIHIERMLIAKMQLLDMEHLLLRYAHRPNQTADKYYTENTKRVIERIFPLYVIYSMKENTVIKIFDANSLELLYIQRNFTDDLRNVRSLQTQRSSSSPSNNYYYRSVFDLAIKAMLELDDTSEFKITIPVGFPIPSQSFSTSPYLDYSIFYYDETNISALQGATLFPQNPICFYDIKSRKVKFRLHLESINNYDTQQIGLSRRSPPYELVGYIFHPYDPCIISLQRLRTRYVINFHVYNGVAKTE